MQVPDKGYVNLLTYLHRPTGTILPISAVQASISYYLAHLSPSPTPLSAALVSSPFFLPYSHAKIEFLSNASRQAVHVKYRLLQARQGGLFQKGIKASFGDWTKGVVAGLKGGPPIVRLALAGGLLIGLQDVSKEVDFGNVRWRDRIQNEIVLAVAETMDLHGRPVDGWEREFQPKIEEESEVDALSLALIQASYSMPFVSSEKISALPLQTFIPLLISTISATFEGGAFLSTLSHTLEMSSTGQITIKPTDPLAQFIISRSSSPSMNAMGPLSKLASRSLVLLVEDKPKKGLVAVKETFDELERISATLEADWASSALAGAREQDIAQKSREVTTAIWTILKTVLFSIVMITDACLSALAYVAPPAKSPSDFPHPRSIALQTLRILFHLSFVISQFGGVTTTSTSSFKEMRKVFYTALDFSMAHSPGEEADLFVRHLVSDLEKMQHRPPTFAQAKKAYAFACIEQVISVLSDACLEQVVLPLCLPHLSDPTYRETFEAAHSVVLAIFATHASRGEGKVVNDTSELRSPDAGPDLAEKLVPFYTECLIENSQEGRLNIEQLCMAFTALVHSAATVYRGPIQGNETRGHVLAQYCTDALLVRIESVSRAEKEAQGGPTKETLHRLHLMLVSAIPALPLALLPGVLANIRDIMMREDRAELREELLHALFQEMLVKVGDAEKEFVIRWWRMHAPALTGKGPQSTKTEAKRTRL